MDIETKRFCFLYHKRLRNWWQLFPVRGWLPLLVFSYGAKKGGSFCVWRGGSIMATTRIMPFHVGKGCTESRAISDIIDYVVNPQKTDNGRLITGFACDSRMVDAGFLLTKRQYIVAAGRVQGRYENYSI